MQETKARRRTYCVTWHVSGENSACPLRQNRVELKYGCIQTWQERKTQLHLYQQASNNTVELSDEETFMKNGDNQQKWKQLRNTTWLTEWISRVKRQTRRHSTNRLKVAVSAPSILKQTVLFLKVAKGCLRSGGSFGDSAVGDRERFLPCLPC